MSISKLQHEMSILKSQHERLQEIKDQIKESLEEATQIIRRSENERIIEAFKGYVLGNILPQLDDEHDFLSGSMFSFQDAIDELDPGGDEEEEEEEIESL